MANQKVSCDEEADAVGEKIILRQLPKMPKYVGEKKIAKNFKINL